MTGIANHAKRSEHEQFGESVKEVSSAICGLVESSAQVGWMDEWMDAYIWLDPLGWAERSFYHLAIAFSIDS